MNKMEIKFAAKIENEVLARNAISTFISSLNPSLEEIGEIKTIVSEAVSNAIIHGYQEDETKDVILKCVIDKKVVTITVTDFGVGIKDIDVAKTPHYSSRPDLERAGMGLTIMETLCDDFDIRSIYGMGSKVTLIKEISSIYEDEGEKV